MQRRQEEDGNTIVQPQRRPKKTQRLIPIENGEKIEDISDYGSRKNAKRKNPSPTPTQKNKYESAANRYRSKAAEVTPSNYEVASVKNPLRLEESAMVKIK